MLVTNRCKCLRSVIGNDANLDGNRWFFYTFCDTPLAVNAGPFFANQNPASVINLQIYMNAAVELVYPPCIVVSSSYIILQISVAAIYHPNIIDTGRHD